MKNQYIIPIFIPHVGFANDYMFFNPKTMSGELKEITKEKVKETIDLFLKNLKDEDANKEICFYGGIFTAMEMTKQAELLSVACEYVKEGKVDSIRISTRPDYINKEILKMIKRFKVQTIELEVPTSNDYILSRCKRTYKFEDIKKVSKLIRRNGFSLGFQMMLGLPESTRNDDLNTAKDLVKLKPKMVRIYPVLVIKGTGLEQEYNNGDFTPLTVGQAVERTKELYYYFIKKKVNIIRIGLQSTELISDPKTKEIQLIDGPYDEKFEQLVEDAVWYDSIVERIKKFNVKVKEVEISINLLNEKNITGHNNENIDKLRELYDVDVVIVKDEDKIEGKFDMKILKTYSDFLEESSKVVK